MSGLEQIAADIPPELAAVDSLLSRYARWACARSRGGRVHTVERMYVAETEKSARYALDNRREAAYGAATREPVMPTPEALAVQRALGQVPLPERQVLAALYIPGRVPAWKRLADLRVPPRLSQLRHVAGLRMLQNLLRTAR